MSSFPPSSSSSSSSSSLSSSSSSESDSDNDEGEYNQDGQGVNAPPLTVKAAKDRYRKMKVHLQDSIRSNELLKEELKRYQRLLLRINQDKYFLFERLLAHEKPPPKKSSKNASSQQPTSSSSTLPGTGEVKVPKKRGPKPKKKPTDEVVPTLEDSLSLPPPASLIRTAPAGQSLLKLKLSTTTASGSGPSPSGGKKSELVFRAPSGGRKGQKRKADFSEDSSSNDADHLFREAASKTTEQVPDQLFDDVGH